MAPWWGAGRERLFGAGSTMDPRLTGVGGFGSGFFEPMGEDRLGMRCGPAVGQYLPQTQSGVMKSLRPDQRLWYHRRFAVPEQWAGQRVLLHFGAGD